MTSTTVTISAYTNTGSRVLRLTYPSSIQAFNEMRSIEASRPDVQYIEVAPRRIADLERVGKFFLAGIGKALAVKPDTAVYVRAEDDDPRLDLPEVGTLGDLQGMAEGFKAAGLEVTLEHPGMLVTRVGTTDIVLDTDLEFRVGVYEDDSLWKTGEPITGLVEFPLTQAGRRAAMAHFMLTANAQAEGVVDAAGNVTHEGITSTIDGTIVAVEGHPTVPAAEDTMLPLERLISELTMDEDGIRTILSALPEEGVLDQDTREYIDGILIPMSKRLMGYLKLTAAARVNDTPVALEDDEDEDDASPLEGFTREVKAMHDRLEDIRECILDVQADMVDEAEQAGYLSGQLRAAGVVLATLSDDMHDAC